MREEQEEGEEWWWWAGSAPVEGEQCERGEPGGRSLTVAPASVAVANGAAAAGTSAKGREKEKATTPKADDSAVTGGTTAAAGAAATGEGEQVFMNKGHKSPNPNTAAMDVQARNQGNMVLQLLRAVEVARNIKLAKANAKITAETSAAPAAPVPAPIAAAIPSPNTNATTAPTTTPSNLNLKTNPTFRGLPLSIALTQADAFS